MNTEKLPTFPPKKPLGPSATIIAGLSITLVIMVAVLIGLSNQLESRTSATAPGPVRTVTVTVNHDVASGVSQAQFDSCKGAYADVVGLLRDQTKILEDVSFAASNGFTAVANGDQAGLDDATSTISGLSSQEQGLQPRVDAIDTTACQ